MRRRGALLAALLLAAAPAGAIEPFPEPEPVHVPWLNASLEAFREGDLMGTLTRPAGAPAGRRPAVILVHDAAGADPRGDRYAEQLAAAGFLVLDLLSHPADAPALARARAALAARPEVDPGRIAALGFGAGAQAALAVPFAARALLYPGCARLAPGPAPEAPALLAHGEADPANPPPACARAAARLATAGAPVRRLAYPRAGYAWDHPAIGRERVMLPSPVGDGRVPAMPWPDLAEMVASEVAGFLAAVLVAGAP